MRRGHIDKGALLRSSNELYMRMIYDNQDNISPNRHIINPKQNATLS